MNEILTGSDARRFAERKRDLCRTLLGFLSEIREAKWLAEEKAKKALSDNEEYRWIIKMADLLADLIAKYADEINFEELPDPEKFLLVRTMKESYKRYTAKRNRYLKEQISLEYVLTDS